MAGEGGRTYLVYGDNGMRLVYEGDDPAGCEAACRTLAATAAGYVSGYQFVGSQRFELRCYFDSVPAAAFVALRTRRDLFDFGWHADGHPESA
ncbi:MAG: hypothetical protein ACYDCQ_05955 [Dehalococcoidia bacterium]